MGKETCARILLLSMVLVVFLLRPSASAEDESKILHFAVAKNAPVNIDRLLHSAFRRIGYNLTTDTAGMISAIQMADSGEKDGLSVFHEGLEARFPHLVRIPESLGRVKFEAYGPRGSRRDIGSWEDLTGYRVGTLSFSVYVEQSLSGYAADFVRRPDVESLAEAVRDGECDLFVVPNPLPSDMPVPPGIEKLGLLESGDTFPYLNVRHAHLVPEVARSLRSMKEDGTFERIVRRDSGLFRNSRAVLIVSSYTSDDSWEKELREGIIQEFSHRGDIAWHFVSLNSNHIMTNVGRTESIIDTIRSSITLNPPDIVIATGINAVSFVGDQYSLLFDGIPVVLCGMNDARENGMWKFEGNESRVTGRVPALENVLQILELFPDTQKIFLVNDHTELGFEWRRQADAQLGVFKGRLEILHNEDGLFSDLLDALQGLSEGTVVLFGHYNVDGKQFYHSQRDIQTMAAANAKVPIFGMRGDSIGYGQIGGKYLEPFLFGKAAAEVALSLLDDSGSARTVFPDELASWIFDENEIRKWEHLENAHLPSGARLINRRLSKYEENPVLFVVLCAFFLLALAVIAMLCISREVLRRKNNKLLEIQKTLHTAEELLKRDWEILEIKNRLEVALEASNAGVWEIDLVENVFTADQRVIQMFRLGSELRMTVDEFIEKISEREIGFMESEFCKGLMSGYVPENEMGKEFSFVREDGELGYFSRCFKSIPAPDGTTSKVVGMVLDVTSKVQMEKELIAAKEAAENANRSKSRFLSSISHEIRTPMNAITGMAGLLLAEDLTGRQRKYAHDIKISAASLLAIINDILDISKMDAGKFSLVPVSYDFAGFLSALQSMFSFAAREKGIEFFLETRANLPRYLYGDDVRLRQILVNLIGNGVKFTEKGFVRLTVSLSGEKLRFEVSDTGTGIKKENLERIFDSFEQIEEGKQKAVGTGLGLFITRNLVEMMDGSIGVESEYGRGTVFHVEIPFVPGEKVDAQEHQMPFVTAPQARVLVVDDNEINLDVAAGMLRLHNIDCDRAFSGYEALEKVKNTKYDLIFMDHMMPEMDGVETTETLRKNERRGEEIPVIALTANAVEGVRELLVRSGMNDYLSKPVQENLLNQILARWLPKEKIVYATNPCEDLADVRKIIEESSLLRRLSRFQKLDLANSLRRISGMAGLYEQTFAVVVRRLPVIIESLWRHLHKKDMKSFSIEVHGVKSSLANIGAVDASEKARILEMRSKDGDTEFCLGHTPPFLEELQSFHRELARVLAEEREAAIASKKKGSVVALRQKLPAMKTLMETFMGDEALDLAREEQSFDYGPDLNAALEELTGRILEFDSDGALDLINRMIQQGA